MTQFLKQMIVRLRGSNTPRPTHRAVLNFDGLETRFAPAAFQCYCLVSIANSGSDQGFDDVLVSGSSANGHVKAF